MAAPVITSLSISSGKPFTSTIINGSDLDQGTVTVNFGSNPTTTFLSKTNTQIEVVIPLIAVNTYPVTVTNAGGTSNSQNFTIQKIDPILTGQSNYGPFIPEVVLTVTGSNFALLGAPTVFFHSLDNGVNYPVTVIDSSGSYVTFAVPEIPGGPYTGVCDVYITNGMGGSAYFFLFVNQYGTWARNIFAETGLSITGVEYSMDNGSTWQAVPSKWYTLHSFTAKYRGTMNNPDHLSSVGFTIKIQPFNIELAVYIGNLTTKTLTTNNYTNGDQALTVEFRAVLP